MFSVYLVGEATLWTTSTLSATAVVQVNTTIPYSESVLLAQTLLTAVPIITDSLASVDVQEDIPSTLTMVYAMSLAQLDNTTTPASFSAQHAPLVLTAVVLETDSLPSAVASLANHLTQSMISVILTAIITNTMTLTSKAV